MASTIPSSTPSTPKRKHCEVSDDGKPLPSLNTTKFSFDLNSPAEDGSNSPRTKVAHKFRGLAIDGDSGSRRGVACGAGDQVPGKSTDTRNSTPDCGDEVMRNADEDDPFSRKRVKRLEQPAAPPDSPNGFKLSPEQATSEWADGLRARLDPAIVRSSKTANRSQRNSSSDSKPRRRRSGTPPLSSFIKSRAPSTATAGEAVAAVASTGSDSATKQESGCDSSPEAEAGTAEDDTSPLIVDPIRAALTWHEDEITIYDPNDEDDDGTGINGIGFKPTATIAYTRLVRRKQQIAEYKKREEREARALRTQRRRRESGAGATSGEEATASTAAVQARRVHFMEAEPVTVITT